MELQQRINALANQHARPSDEKMERQIIRMERMAGFYQDKAETAPEKQANMFKGFVAALSYAMTIIKMYRKLARAINELAEEANNGQQEGDN